MEGKGTCRIDSYEFGSITVNGKSYRSDLIIFTDRVRENWWRKEGHSLCPEDLQEVVQSEPEVVIIGTGASGVLDVPKETMEWLLSKGIEVISAPTPEATRQFNRLVRSKKVVALLHLTC